MEAAELARFRALLDEERLDLRRQLEDLGADADEDRMESLDFDGGFADSAQATAERARLLSFVEQIRERLTAVNRAIGRIERGAYGLCERCGQPIDPARLEALPSATLCVSCKQKASSGA